VRLCLFARTSYRRSECCQRRLGRESRVEPDQQPEARCFCRVRVELCSLVLNEGRHGCCGRPVVVGENESHYELSLSRVFFGAQSANVVNLGPCCSSRDPSFCVSNGHQWHSTRDHTERRMKPWGRQRGKQDRSIKSESLGRDQITCFHPGSWRPSLACLALLGRWRLEELPQSTHAAGELTRPATCWASGFLQWHPAKIERRRPERGRYRGAWSERWCGALHDGHWMTFQYWLVRPQSESARGESLEG